jgi:prevent-host-death family protein
MEIKMSTMSVRDARKKISQLLDEVAAGEEVIILRRGEPAARLVGMGAKPVVFPDRSSLRNALPPMTQSAGDTVRLLQDNERH